MDAFGLPIAVLAFSVVVVGGVGDLPASTMVCPPDRPNARQVDHGVVACTLKACLGELVCPAGTATCFRVPSNDCNTCTHNIATECLTDEELRKAGGSP